MPPVALKRPHHLKLCGTADTRPGAPAHPGVGVACKECCGAAGGADRTCKMQGVGTHAGHAAKGFAHTQQGLAPQACQQGSGAVGSVLVGGQKQTLGQLVAKNTLAVAQTDTRLKKPASEAHAKRRHSEQLRSRQNRSRLQPKNPSTKAGTRAGTGPGQNSALCAPGRSSGCAQATRRR
jgi:hypothetical protein